MWAIVTSDVYLIYIYTVYRGPLTSSIWLAYANGTIHNTSQNPCTLRCLYAIMRKNSCLLRISLRGMPLCPRPRHGCSDVTPPHVAFTNRPEPLGPSAHMLDQNTSHFSRLFKPANGETRDTRHETRAGIRRIG